MSDEIKYKAIVTSIGSYMQKEGDLTWTLVPGTALDDYTPTRLTNEQVEKYFKTEKAWAELDEDIRALSEALRAKVQEGAESFRALWEQLQEGITAAEKQAQEPQRPDYKTRPNCCTRAKVKPHKKQRSRER